MLRSGDREQILDYIEGQCADHGDSGAEPRPHPTTGAPGWPEALDRQAFHGIAGEIVSAIEPHTEADPAALLIQLLVGFGNLVGRGPHTAVEADRHGVNLFVALVGKSAKGRKGTSWSQVRRVLEAVDEEWARRRILSGLSSGEGLIWSVRDQIEKQQPVKANGRVVEYQAVVEDPGISDKRLLALEPELASVLRVMGRDGSTLSALIRQAWDTGDLRVLTKNSPAVATGAHISIVGHVTHDELLRELNSTEAANGFANRFLWVCSKRSKQLPEGGKIQEVDFGPLVRRLSHIAESARSAGRVDRDEEAREIWHKVYGELSEGKPGLFGSVTGRAEAQVLRLSLLYALLDGAGVIGPDHLLAALAVWEYAEASARYIFGDALGNPMADRILEQLRMEPGGLARTDIRNLFGRHGKGSDIDLAIALRNLAKARNSPQWHPPRPWRSKEESEIVRRYAFWWFTCRDPRRPSCRAWAKQLGISHTWLQKLVQEFEADPDAMWQLQRAYGDPTLSQLNEARERTQELRKLGGLHPRRRRRRVDPDQW